VAEKDIYCVAYINRDRISTLNRELTDFGYNHIQVIIPTVKVLRKVFKGKSYFDDVPLLFNYGFVKAPYHNACDPEWLSQFRQDISAIFAWIKDPAAAAQNARPGESYTYASYPRTGIATEQEVAHLVSTAAENSIHSDDEMNALQPGQFIVLQGYPFENMPAEIVKINHRKKEVKVKLDVNSMMDTITVNFENVFYSIYRGGYDENFREDSLDRIGEMGPGFMDKIFFKQQDKQ